MGVVAEGAYDGTNGSQVPMKDMGWVQWIYIFSWDVLYGILYKKKQIMR